MLLTGQSRYLSNSLVDDVRKENKNAVQDTLCLLESSACRPTAPALGTLAEPPTCVSQCRKSQCRENNLVGRERNQDFVRLLSDDPPIRRASELTGLRGARERWCLLCCICNDPVVLILASLADRLLEDFYCSCFVCFVRLTCLSPSPPILSPSQSHTPTYK